MILVIQPVRKAQQNLVFQKAVTLKLTETERKRFTFITYSSKSVGLPNFTEIQGGHVNCCVDLNEIPSINFAPYTAKLKIGTEQFAQCQNNPRIISS